MDNTINKVKNGPGLFARGIAQTLKDSLKLGAFFVTNDPTEGFDQNVNGFKQGDTIYKSIPPRYIPQSDNLDITSAISDSVEEKKPITLNKTESIGMQLDSLELATDIDVKNALVRHGIPAAESIAQNMESRCFGIAADAIYNSVGTAGSNSFTVSDVLASRALLNKNLCPMKDRMLFLNSDSGALAVDARKGVFQSSEQIKKQYEDGYIGRADGYDWVETELISTHANGSDVTGVAVNDASVAEGASTLTIDGASASITVGSVFTIADVYRVHPITKEVTNDLQQFTVTSAGTVSIGISPSLYAGSAGLKNINALPADNAALVFVGAASTSLAQNLAVHKSAFTLVTAPLYAPKGVDLVATETIDGITVNIVRDFDVLTRKVTTRLDVLYAFDKIRPEWGCRLTA